MEGLKKGVKDERNKELKQDYMYVAKKPCGKVVAMVWDVADCEKGIAKSVARWIARGDKVERISRHKDDPMPEMSCDPLVNCACRQVKEMSKIKSKSKTKEMSLIRDDVTKQINSFSN